MTGYYGLCAEAIDGSVVKSTALPIHGTNLESGY